MPSRTRRSVGLRAIGLRACLAVAFLAACSTGGPPVPEVRPARDNPALRPPMASYPLASPPELAARADAIFESLRRSQPSTGDLAAVRAQAQALLDEAPDFHPAAVLVAQADYLDGADREVLARLEPIVEELPEYVACQVLRGFAAERAGELVTAYEAFARVAEPLVDAGGDERGTEIAAVRARELEERAVEIVFNRLDDALARGRIDDAETHRAWLERWIGDEIVVLRAARRILAAGEDREGEREAVCRLLELEPSSELRQRCAELEIDVGDVRNGLELFEQLAAEFPDDPEVAEQLGRAKFRWRLELLPEHVRDLGRKGELTRADLATLLYWLVPQVRSSRVTDPPIATDILEHPLRDEIVKVAGLDLMRVDEVLHRFDPDDPATRLTTFAALLRLLDLSERGVACLRGVEPRRLTESRSWVCDKAARCRLIPEEAECLPRARVSGDEALDFFRRSLDHSGTRP